MALLAKKVVDIAVTSTIVFIWMEHVSPAVVQVITGHCVKKVSKTYQEAENAHKNWYSIYMYMVGYFFIVLIRQ